jgi:hypothetical protein
MDACYTRLNSKRQQALTRNKSGATQVDKKILNLHVALSRKKQTIEEKQLVDKICTAWVGAIEALAVLGLQQCGTTTKTDLFTC